MADVFAAVKQTRVCPACEGRVKDYRASQIDALACMRCQWTLATQAPLPATIEARVRADRAEVEIGVLQERLDLYGVSPALVNATVARALRNAVKTQSRPTVSEIVRDELVKLVRPH